MRALLHFGVDAAIFICGAYLALSGRSLLGVVMMALAIYRPQSWRR